MKLLSSLSLKAKIIAGVAATAAVAGTVALVLVLSSPDAFRLLKIFEMTGKSVVTRVNSGAMDAYTGMNLESGDVVEVGAESTMTLSLDSNKYLSLDPNTILELIAEGTEADSKTTVNLRSGGVLNEITEPLSAESSYSVNTPKATMAVRGTSFYVSVRLLDDGSYITDVSVFHGKVEVQLLDEEGNPRGEPVIVEPNESVAILTLPVEGNTTGAEINGTSCFILRKNDGSDTFAIVGEGEDPIMPLNALIIPRSVIERVLNTHDSTDIVLSEAVLRALLGDETFAEGAETTASLAADETTAAETTTAETMTTTASETTVPETTVTEETLVPSETTTAVTTAVTTKKNTEAATSVPETTKKTVKKTTAATEKTTVKTKATTTAVQSSSSTSSQSVSSVTAPTAPVVPVTTTEATTTTETEPVYYTVSFVSNPGGQTVAAQQTVEEGEYAETPTSYSESIYVNGIEYVFWGIESPLGPITANTNISVKYVEKVIVFSVYV
ncbi:MAG: FecR domain-containing protein, partial [Oscillospiraceae bacterium]|nr:FecR domain-containing protein [Oscillospiraceae bacterium]